MPLPILAFALLLLVPLVAVVLMPVALVQRYRRGTARRQARAWLAALNVATIAVSAALLLATAAVANLWVPRAFAATATGLVAGGLLGLLGLRLTRWERTSASLHYTPNRWLVLTVTLVVTARLVYGVWRAWHAWHVRPDDTSWLAAAGVAGSMAAGALVLGYYFSYWAGVRRRAAHRG